MIQMIVVMASVLLGLILYPILLKTYTRIVTNLYRNLPGANKTEKEDRPPQKEVEKPSIIGKSKGITGHSRTKTATDSETEVLEKKEHTFAPDTEKEEKETAEIDVNVYLEKIENPKQEDIDAEEESLELETGEGAFLASGLSYDELVSAGQVVTKEQPSDKEKDEAGRVFYQHRDMLLFEQVKASAPELGKSIAALIDFHLDERAKENASVSENIYPDGFKDFDIDSIF